MGERLTDIWVYLAQTPLLWLTVTVGVYYVADVIYKKLNMMPLAHPLVLAVVGIVPVLMLTDTPYEVYFDGAQFVHFLLGPATVALAVPLYIYSGTVKRLIVPLGVALAVGCLTGILSAVGIGYVTGVSDVTLRSLAPKSVTTPIAMGVTEQIGGIPSLTAVFVIITGIIGALAGKELLDLLRVQEPSARGLAMGLASHGLGTARAFQMSEQAGAFSGLAMGLNGALTAVVVPVLAHWLFV